MTDMTQEFATVKIRVFPSSIKYLKMMSAEFNRSYAELIDDKIVRPYKRRTQHLLRKSN